MLLIHISILFSFGFCFVTSKFQFCLSPQDKNNKITRVYCENNKYNLKIANTTSLEKFPQNCTIIIQCASEFSTVRSQCFNGSWNPQIPRCKRCGGAPVRAKSLVSVTEPERIGGAPWHTTIYKRTTHTAVCGGTIISEHAILSAANCFFDASTRKIAEPIYYVAIVGEITKDYNIAEDSVQKTFEIRKFYFHDNGFYGEPTKYSSDIVILVVRGIIEFSDSIFPVCIDWSLPDLTLGEKSFGQVSMWKSRNDEATNHVLQTVVVEYVSYKTCVELISTNHSKQYLAYDNLCNVNDSEFAISRNSGSGLVTYDTASKSYFLRGIVSIHNVPKENNLTVFVDIRKYLKWISKIVSQIENHTADEIPVTDSADSCVFPSEVDRVDDIECYNVKLKHSVDRVPHSCKVSVSCIYPNDIQNVTLSQTCLKGKWYPYSLDCTNVSRTCGALNRNSSIGKTVSEIVRSEYWPWLVSFQNGTQSTCVGTLISNEWILTSGYCAEKIGQANIKFAHLGDLHLTDVEDEYTPVDMMIDAIIIHPEYNELDHNIALIRLKVPLNRTKSILPACLPASLKLGQHTNNLTDSLGFISTYVKGYLIETLTKVLHLKQCYDNYDETYWVTDTDICVKSHSVNVGTPFIMQDNTTNVYYLVGIYNFVSRSPTDKDSGSLTFYTRVAYYSEWVKDTMGNFTSLKPTESPCTAENTESCSTSSYVLQNDDKQPLIYQYGSVNRSQEITSEHRPSQKTWPWVAMFLFQNHVLCLGALVSDRFILTEGRCTWTINLAGVKFAHLGDIRVNNEYDEASPIDVPIDSDISHPQNSFNAPYYFIDIIRLKTKVTFSKFIQPICLLNYLGYCESSTSFGEKGIFIGYDKTNNTLTEVEGNIIDTKKCYEMTSSTTKFPDSEMCTDLSHDVIHSELLIAQDNTTGAYYLLGLHSHSDFVKPVVNDSGSLHYYYNVTYFGDWIAHEIEIFNKPCIETLQKVNSIASMSTTSVPSSIKASHSLQCGKLNKRLTEVTSDSTPATAPWPWLASFLHNGALTCLGSLISNEWILTSERCAHSIENLNISVTLLGAFNLKENFENTSTMFVPIEKVISYPHRNPIGERNSVALIKLKISITACPSISPVCIPPKIDFQEVGNRAVFLDYGKPSFRLFEIETEILNVEECYRNVDKSSQYAEDKLCARFSEGNIGSPLLLRNNTNGNYYLVGIYNSVSSWQVEGKFLVKVSYFSNWIAETISS